MKQLGWTLLQDWQKKAGPEGESIVQAYLKMPAFASSTPAPKPRRPPDEQPGRGEREAVLLAALPHNNGTAMRRLLEFLYDGSAWLAALAMIGVLLMVLLSIVSRQFGFHVAGTDAYAGYSMAAAGFLALAHTLKRNEHIRVTLLLTKLKGRKRHALEMWALSATVFLSGLFAFYSVRLAWVSRSINDMSTSSDATPLWIPQIAMAIGTIILFIAFVDDWVMELQGRRKTTGSEEALHHE